MDRFIKFQRLEDSELLRHMIRCNHNAFILLTVIANRARRMKEPHPATKRKQFEAEIGDHGEYGLSRQQYRTALKHLVKWNLITIKSTIEGTVATFCNGDVFDINPEGDNHQTNQRLTNAQPSPSQRVTTKKNAKNEKNGKNEEKRTIYSASDDAPRADSSSISYCGLSGVSLDQFNQFMDAFADKRGKKKAAESWRKIGNISDDLRQAILAGASRYAKGRDRLIEKGSTPKMAQGWLADRRWEDEPAVGQKKKRLRRSSMVIEMERRKASRPQSFKGT